jgi:hypothetical protein
MYAMVCTCLDISQAVNLVCCNMANISKAHWQAVMDTSVFMGHYKCWFKFMVEAMVLIKVSLGMLILIMLVIWTR